MFLFSLKDVCIASIFFCILDTYTYIGAGLCAGEQNSAPPNYSRTGLSDAECRLECVNIFHF